LVRYMICLFSIGGRKKVDFIAHPDLSIHFLSHLLKTKK
jgi:hypothetical protein